MEDDRRPRAEDDFDGRVIERSSERPGAVGL
jgi:hypothetical protein